MTNFKGLELDNDTLRRLDSRRRQLKLSKAGVAREMGFTPEHMHGILTGYRRPSIETFRDLVEFLGMEIKVLKQSRTIVKIRVKRTKKKVD